MGVILILLTHFNCSFETITDCQCNGHSSCGLDGRTCIQPCEDHSEGAHCDKCSRGYYGNPVNGGECNACQVWPLTQFYSFSIFYENCPPGELISLIGEEIVLFPFFSNSLILVLDPWRTFLTLHGSLQNHQVCSFGNLRDKRTHVRCWAQGAEVPGLLSKTKKTNLDCA